MEVLLIQFFFNQHQNKKLLRFVVVFDPVLLQDISMNIVKESFNLICAPLMYIINLSLNSGAVPQGLFCNPTFLTRLSADTIECICENTVCQVTNGVCYTHFGCFSSSLIEEDKVTKGCLKNEAHKEIICQTEPDHPVICCNTNFFYPARKSYPKHC